MATGIMFLVMFGLMFLGVPIAVAIFLALVVLIGMNPVTTANFLAQTLYSGVANFTMLALPFFMVAGTIMETGGLSKRLVNAAKSMIGGITGSLGMVTIIACMFFGAVSGSAPATVAAIGAIMIPMMVQDGYNKYYATGLTCCAGGLGVIVPPSYPMVLYGVTVNQSVGDLFMAGLGPALVVGGILMVINYVYCKKHGLKGDNKFNLKAMGKSFWDAKWALVMPVIILGGIYGGYFTATEAAVVAAVYGIIIGLFVYKELKFPKLWEIFRDNTAFIAGTMFVMAPAKATGQVFAYLNITKIISDFLFSISTNYYVILFLIFIILFIVGMFVPHAAGRGAAGGRGPHPLRHHHDPGPGHRLRHPAGGPQPVCRLVHDGHQYRQNHKGGPALPHRPHRRLLCGGLLSPHLPGHPGPGLRNQQRKEHLI